MVELLAQFHEGATLSPASTELLRGMMLAARSRIGAKLPDGTQVANKTGTGTGSFNDVGIVTLPDGRHLILAVYVARARRLSFDTGNALVADIARAVYDSAL
jgi:beta-lactamase class A